MQKNKKSATQLVNEWIIARKGAPFVAADISKELLQFTKGDIASALYILRQHGAINIVRKEKPNTNVYALIKVIDYPQAKTNYAKTQDSASDTPIGTRIYNFILHRKGQFSGRDVKARFTLKRGQLSYVMERLVQLGVVKVIGKDGNSNIYKFVKEASSKSIVHGGGPRIPTRVATKPSTDSLSDQMLALIPDAVLLQELQRRLSKTESS